MKKIFTLLIVFAITTTVFSQVPEKMSYQAIVRNSSGNLVKCSPVGMQISILQGSATGTAVYVETQTEQTNENGLVTIEIGGGTAVTGSFDGIDWSTGLYFIKTETDPAGGTNYTITGTSQLLSVPYALYSKSAADAATKRYVDSLKQEFSNLRERLYIELPILKDPKVISEQIMTSGKKGYGSSVAVSGNLAVLGAGWEDTEQANEAGAVYVYEYNGSQWIEKQRITNPSGSYDAIFGQSVATNGTYIIITEPNAKSAHIYSKSGSTWILEKTFTVTNVSSEKFGISCDVYENTVVIGSGSVFATYCSAVGSAYVYEKNGIEWTNTAILTPSGGLAHDCFGHSVGIYGNTIAVGAGRSSCYVSEQGYVCIFGKDGTSWSETQRLIAPDGTGQRFGEDLDIENNQLIVSNMGYLGAAYYFEKGATWEFKQKITSPNLSGNDNFGGQVNLSNNYLLIGAGSDSEIFSSQGAAYLYEFEGTGWIKKLKIIPSDARVNGGFGYTLFLNNNFVFAFSGGGETVYTNAYVYTFE